MSKHRRPMWLLALGLSLAVCPLPRGTLSAQEPKIPTHAESWNGIITASTSPNGVWVLLTAGPRQGKKLLQAAFTLESESVLSTPVKFSGQGEIDLLDRPPVYKELALRVALRGGECHFYKLTDFAGRVPANCVPVNVVGIARYKAALGSTTLPASHADLARGLFPKLEEEGPKPLPNGKLDPCGSCVNGNPGSTGCSSFVSGPLAQGKDCSVTCGTGYYSCCNLTCFCCKEEVTLLHSPGRPAGRAIPASTAKRCAGSASRR